MDDKPATSLRATPEPQQLKAITSEEPYSYRREWLAQARSDFCGKLAQEKTISGVAGFALLLLTVILFFIQSQPVLTLLPVGIFILIVLSYFTYVLFRAPGKIDERKRLAVSAIQKREEELKALSESSDAGKRKRDFLAQRLTSLLHEAGEVEYGAVSLRSIEGMGKVWRQTEYHKRAEKFVKEHYGHEVADRYEKEKSNLLEELLADCCREGDGAETAKPKITGEIKEVFFEKEINLNTSLTVSEDCYFCYWFTVRLYVANIGAPTGIERFRLMLNSKEGALEGERLPVSGYRIQRVTGDEPLTDIEASNDIPLEHTRNGWACFAVPSIKSNENDGAVEDMQIEVQVIDKTKTPHLLGRSTQVEWRENSRHHRPRVEPNRSNWPPS